MSDKPDAKPETGKSKRGEADHNRNTGAHEHGLAERSVTAPHPYTANTPPATQGSDD